MHHPAFDQRSSVTTVSSRYPGLDPATNAVWERLARVARTSLPVLIVGETGSGKELAAEWLSSQSQRKERLLRVNCATFSETLIESELFGHERGAFTGAHATRQGIFEVASGGTLFLDEVGELPLTAQAKLLRVLETGEILRLGSTLPRRVDVRIVAATHRDLPAWVADGKFREDLYFRLNGISVRIPPLRTRSCEILPLARQFAANCAERWGIAVPEIDDEVADALLAHAWPGNVRELRNAMERGVALSRNGRITLTGLELIPVAQEPSGARESLARASGDEDASSIRDAMLRYERSRIEQALLQTHGNQTRAAALLGISRRTLTNKLGLFGLPRPRKRDLPSP